MQTAIDEVAARLNILPSDCRRRFAVDTLDTVPASLFEDPSFAFAGAATVGVLAQILARHLAIPGIVLLLAAGIALGPDGAGIIRPQALGDGLPAIVGLAVAVILFEGGLGLKLSALRGQSLPIRRLITIGALITAIGGALSAFLFLRWDFRLCLLFGTLVIVTGPTVITPLVRQMRLDARVSTILEAEGILIDAVGATVAVVALEIAIAPSILSGGLGIFSVAWRLGVGAVIGSVFGLFLASLLRIRRAVPAGLENILALSVALFVFALSNALVHESGITAAIAAGFVVGHLRSRAVEHIAEFKEQLTTLWIAALFVLLAADVRLADVADLGTPGIAVVAALMLVVRPVTVFVCTRKTDLSWKQRAFLSWLAPRGIVAAAVASLFALELDRAGIDGGEALKALVFLVIAITVTVQGLSGGAVASLLGLRRPANSGTLILGAGPLAIALGQLIDAAGEPVVIIDSNPDGCAAAKRAGLSVTRANGLRDETLSQLSANSRAGFIALTTNDSVNMLFAQRGIEHNPRARAWVALDTRDGGIDSEVVRDAGARVLFGSERSLIRWNTRIAEGRVELERWAVFSEDPATGGAQAALSSNDDDALLPLVVLRRNRPILFDDELRLRNGDILIAAINTENRATAQNRLLAARLRPTSLAASAPDAKAPEPEVELGTITQ